MYISGFSLSCIWARPHRFVWAQPPKESWYPGMVLAGHGVPKALAAVNFSRIPKDISKQLLKMKPKPSNTEKENESLIFENIKIDNVIIEDNCVLVEFFGSHDFGWIKLDNLSHFPPDGAFFPPVISNPETSNLNAKEREKREKTAHPNTPAMKEALTAYDALEQSNLSNKPNDAIPPNLDELLEIDNFLKSMIPPVNKTRGRQPYGSQTSLLGKHFNPVKLPKGFGDLVNITGPSYVSIHNLSPEDLGLTVSNVTEVVTGGMFNSESVSLHNGLSFQDRALWRTRILATALDVLKPVAPGLNIIRPKEAESKSKKTNSTSSTNNSKEGAVESSESVRDFTIKFTTKYASANSVTMSGSKKNGFSNSSSKSVTMNKSSQNNLKLQLKSLTGKEASKQKQEAQKQDLIDLIHIDTTALYTGSSETGRKWMIGIFASPAQSNENAVSTHIVGEGTLHSRRVNFNSPIFFLENKSKEARNNMIKYEIAQLESLTSYMSSTKTSSVLSNNKFFHKAIGFDENNNPVTEPSEIFQDETQPEKRKFRPLEEEEGDMPDLSKTLDAIEEDRKKRIRHSAEFLNEKYPDGKGKPGPKPKSSKTVPNSSQSNSSDTPDIVVKQRKKPGPKAKPKPGISG
jgi:hypothetical protein